MMSSSRKRTTPRTYSKRVLKDSLEPPPKRKHIEAFETITKVKQDDCCVAVASISAKKKLISDYFTSKVSQTLHSSPQSTSFPCTDSSPQSHSIEDTTPPSSPPFEKADSPKARPKRRQHRRLIYKPTFQQYFSMEDNATMPGESAKSTDDFTFAEKDNGKPAADKQSQIDQNENPTTEIESKNDWKNHPLALKPLVYSGAEDRRRKSLLTVAFATIEGGLRANVDPTITERSLLVSNDADQNTANFSGSSLRPSIVRSEVGKFGIHFREEEVKEEVEEDPKGIPIPGGPFDKQDEKEIDEDRPSPVYPGPSAPKSLGHYVKGKFIQTQLDLGPDARKSCSVCQMIYNSTDERDILSHKEFHKNYVEGCSIGSLKTDIPNHPRKLQYNIDENGVEEYIVKVDRFTAASWTRLAENVLRDYVDADLGNRSHGDITRLWGERADPDLARDALEATYFNLNTVQSANAGIPRVPSYAVFLYIRNKRVISVLVAERIKEGKGLSRIQMEEDDFGKWPKEVVMLVDDFKDSSPAWLGVDRIWTHKKCRGKGYAFRLLETARFNCFIFGNYIHRKEVAFSYTTYLGTKFAKSYHREEEFDYVFYDNNESLLPDI